MFTSIPLIINNTMQEIDFAGLTEIHATISCIEVQEI